MKGRQVLVSVTAQCVDCNFQADAKNAHGLGAQHYQKYDHSVVVYKQYEIYYRGPNL